MLLGSVFAVVALASLFVLLNAIAMLAWPGGDMAQGIGVFVGHFGALPLGLVFLSSMGMALKLLHGDGRLALIVSGVSSVVLGATVHIATMAGLNESFMWVTASIFVVIPLLFGGLGAALLFMGSMGGKSAEPS